MRKRLPRWRLYLRRRRLGAALMAVIGVGAALLLFVLGAGIRLLIGPVSLGPFAGALSGALAEALPGITMKYDQAAIEWSREEGKVSLVILGTRVFDQADRIIAQAPKADIDLAAAPLIEGRAVVRRITLVGVQLTMVRDATGKLMLGVGGNRRERDILDRIAEALSKSKGPSSLQAFAVRKARFALYDEASKLFLVSPRADMALTAGANEGLNASIDAAIELSGHAAKLTGSLTLPPGGKRIDGRIALTGLSLAALAKGSDKFAMLKDSGLIADIGGDFALEGAKLVKADFTVTAGGDFALPRVKGKVRLKSLTARGSYDGDSGRVRIASARIDSDKISGTMSGVIALPLAAGARLGFDARLRKLSLDLPGIFAGRIAFAGADLRGSWDENARVLSLADLSLHGRPFGLKAAGSLSLPRDASAGIVFKGETVAIGVRDLVRYWPLEAAGGARAWVDENMPAGRVGPIQFDIRIAPGARDAAPLPADAVSVRFPIHGVEARYIEGLTHLTDVGAKATLSAVDFAVDIEKGRIGPLGLAGGRFHIPDLTAKDQTGRIAAKLQGSIADVLRLIDMKPLRYPQRFGIDPGTVKGDVAIDLAISVPLLKDVRVDAVGIDIKARGTGFALSLGETVRLSDGTVDFAIDNHKLRAGGIVGIGGSAAKLNVDWAEDFGAAVPASTKIAFKGALDDTARASLGLSFARYIHGPLGVSGTIAGKRGALKNADLALDLTPLAIDLDPIGYNKPAGLMMTGKLTLAFGAHSRPGALSLRIGAQNVAVAAGGRFDEAGKLVELQAPQLRIGPRNDFALALWRGAGETKISVHGKSIDGSRLARQGDGEAGATPGRGDGGPGEAYRLSARLERLILREGVSVSDFGLDAAFDPAERLTALTLSGRIGKTSAVSGTLQAGGDGRSLRVGVGDAGAMFKGLYGFSSIRGGKLDLSVLLPPDGVSAADAGGKPADFKGKLALADFRIVDQPFLTRLFSAGSLTGLVNLMQGQGITVDEFEVPFASQGGVIAIKGARATGPAIGVTADGYIDRPKNEVALKGTLVPLFGLNSVLGNIPVIGDVLTSKQGEGVFGMSYEVKGNGDEPTVSVNPLSVLAPGILRRIFEGRIPTAAQAPSNAGPAAKARANPPKE